MTKNRGSSTITVKGSGSSSTELDQPSTAKPTKGGIVSTPASSIDFVPFAGAGHVLGSRDKSKAIPGSSSSPAKIRVLENVGTLYALGSKIKEGAKSFPSNSATQIQIRHPFGNGTKSEPPKPPSKLPSPKIPAHGSSVKIETVTLDDSREESPSSNNVPCPVCNAQVRLDEINSHLDSCLS